MRILITGGAGFIGSAFIKFAAKVNENIQFCVFDNLHPQVHGPNAATPKLPPNAKFILASILDREVLAQTIRDFNPTHVLHLAAETGTGQSMDEISRYCEINVTGTAILIEELKKYAPNLLKFILTSSRAVYGEGPWLNQKNKTVFPETRQREKMLAKEFMPFHEDGPCLKPLPATELAEPRPASVYASTKLMQEYLALQGGQSQTWKAIILRLQNVYGPGQSLKNPYTGVLSVFSQQILAHKKLNIFEDGKIVRDFVYVDDVVSALYQASQQDLAHSSLFNIGTGTPTSLELVAQTMLKVFGKTGNEYFVSGDFRDGDIRHAVADTNKARSELGWQPNVSLTLGLKNLKDWAEEQHASH